MNIRVTVSAALLLGVVVALGTGALAQQNRPNYVPQLPNQLSPDGLRLNTTPTPRVRVMDSEQVQRARAAAVEGSGEAEPVDEGDRVGVPRPEQRGTVTRRRTTEVDPSELRPTAPAHETRPADGLEYQLEEGVEYGRLIVMSQQDGVSVTIDGEPYPNGSLQGVLLWADEEYEVVLDSGGGEAAATTGTGTRVINVSVGAGETRILMANLGGTTTESSSSTNTPRQRRTREERPTAEEDDEIGYLGVSSSPRGIVYVDGENTGQMTPARRIELGPGRHEVRIFYESEEQFSETKNVLIRSGVNTNVFFRLRRDEPASEEAEPAEDEEEAE